MALAPLTNIALALKLDFGFGRRLKHMVIMGGNIEGEMEFAEESPDKNHSVCCSLYTCS